MLFDKVYNICIVYVISYLNILNVGNPPHRFQSRAMKSYHEVCCRHSLIQKRCRGIFQWTTNIKRLLLYMIQDLFKKVFDLPSSLCLVFHPFTSNWQNKKLHQRLLSQSCQCSTMNLLNLLMFASAAKRKAPNNVQDVQVTVKMKVETYLFWVLMLIHSEFVTSDVKLRYILIVFYV